MIPDFAVKLCRNRRSKTGSADVRLVVAGRCGLSLWGVLWAEFFEANDTVPGQNAGNVRHESREIRVIRRLRGRSCSCCFRRLGCCPRLVTIPDNVLPASYSHPVWKNRMWNSPNSGLASWGCAATFASAEDLRPIRSVKVIILNEQVKLVHQVQLRLCNFTVFPFVMVQYEPDVGPCPIVVVPTKQGSWDTQAATLLRDAHDGGECWRFLSWLTAQRLCLETMAGVFDRSRTSMGMRKVNLEVLLRRRIR